MERTRLWWVSQSSYDASPPIVAVCGSSTECLKCQTDRRQPYLPGKRHLTLYTSQLRHRHPLSLQSAWAHGPRSPIISASVILCSSVHQCTCQGWRDKVDHQQHPCTYGTLCLTLKDQPLCIPLLNYNFHKRAASPSLAMLLTPARPQVKFTTLP